MPVRNVRSKSRNRNVKTLSPELTFQPSLTISTLNIVRGIWGWRRGQIADISTLSQELLSNLGCPQTWYEFRSFFSPVRLWRLELKKIFVKTELGQVCKVSNLGSSHIVSSPTVVCGLSSGNSSLKITASASQNSLDWIVSHLYWVERFPFLVWSFLADLAVNFDPFLSKTSATETALSQPGLRGKLYSSSSCSLRLVLLGQEMLSSRPLTFSVRPPSADLTWWISVLVFLLSFLLSFIGYWHLVRFLETTN